MKEDVRMCFQKGDLMFEKDEGRYVMRFENGKWVRIGTIIYKSITQNIPEEPRMEINKIRLDRIIKF